MTTVKVHWPDLEEWHEVLDRAIKHFEAWYADGYTMALITYAGTCRCTVLTL